jgi:hypothetical protein
VYTRVCRELQVNQPRLDQAYEAHLCVVLTRALELSRTGSARGLPPDASDANVVEDVLAELLDPSSEMVAQLVRVPSHQHARLLDIVFGPAGSVVGRSLRERYTALVNGIVFGGPQPVVTHTNVGDLVGAPPPQAVCSRCVTPPECRAMNLCCLSTKARPPLPAPALPNKSWETMTTDERAEIGDATRIGPRHAETDEQRFARLGQRMPETFAETFAERAEQPECCPARCGGHCAAPRDTGLVHELKTWVESFEDVRTGTKRAEYRRDDRGFEVGDKLWLREWDRSCPECAREAQRSTPPAFPHVSHWPKGYTGRELYARITHVLRGPFIPEHFAMLSIEVLP